MTGEPIRYAVVCDHPELDRRYFVADINDDRPNGGGIEWRIYRGDYTTFFEAVNKRGSRTTPIPFGCGAEGCNLLAELQESTLPELLDKIAPQRDLLTVATIPIEQTADTEDVFDVAFGGADPEPSVIVGSESRHLVPLRTLCEVVRLLRVRGKN
ncbi:MAG: hypothetical protein E6Q57_00215 [Mycobacterium sp.]|nr:MAG: hypothetical protein E6Q57_00215 [Mycobacterium sp.]